MDGSHHAVLALEQIWRWLRPLHPAGRRCDLVDVPLLDVRGQNLARRHRIAPDRVFQERAVFVADAADMTAQWGILVSQVLIQYRGVSRRQHARPTGRNKGLVERTCGPIAAEFRG